jgi:hypothetical protein
MIKGLQLKNISFFLILLNVFQASLFSIFKFNSQSSTLQLSGPLAKIILSTPITSFDGTLKVIDKIQGSIVGTTTSDILTFSNAVYLSDNNGRAYISAKFSPSGSDTIVLSSGHSIEFQNGTVVENLLIDGLGSSIFGQPTFSGSITLADVATDLTIAIQSKLNQSITLNGGKIILGDNLCLQKDVFLLGNGVVDFNGKSLNLPEALDNTWTNTITFENTSSLNLSGYTKLSGTWIFNGETDAGNLVGSGNILDISNGGTIVVGAGQRLYISDLIIKGLGSLGGTILINPTGKLYLSNVTIELAGSYYLESGEVIVQGSNSVVIVQNDYSFQIKNSGELTIDGVALLYELIGSPTTNLVPVRSSSGGVINYLNYGIVKSIFYQGDTLSPQGNVLFGSVNFIQDSLFPSSYILNPTSQLFFINENTANPKTIEIDGQGFFVEFNYGIGQYITIEENVTVRFKNILFKDFDPALINFEGSGSTRGKIIFEDNVVLRFNKDLELSFEKLVFEGNAIIQGSNTTLYLNAEDVLTENLPSKSLTIKNQKIVFGNASAMKCLDDNSKIILQDTSLIMNEAGCNFEKGYLDVKNEVIISGLGQGSITGTSTFAFTSKGILTIKPLSSLKICPDTTFFYNPDTSLDLTSSDSKRHFLLTDCSSSLILDFCTIMSGSMGLAFDFGRMLVDGKTIFKMQYQSGSELELGTALLVELAAGAALDFDGTVIYNDTL